MKTPYEEAPLAQLAAQALVADEAADPPRALDDRATQIAALERALRSRARLRLARRPALAAVVAAVTVAAAAYLAVLSPRSHRNQAARIGAPSGIVTARPTGLAAVEAVQGSARVAGVDGDLAAGDEIAPGMGLDVPGAGELTLRLATGTRLTLASDAAMRVTDIGVFNRFDLERGRLTADVAKLGSGHRFLIATPDAEVEVRGTRFEVVVSARPSTCEPRTRTGVTVLEGVVAVRFGAGEVRVEAGHRWPDCQTSPTDAPRPGRATDRRRQRRQVAQAAPAAAAAAAQSTLAEQNDLMAAALTAEQRGDLEEAERWLDRLVKRHPTGQLADSARAEHRRLTELRDGRVSVP
jgi:hypothetical protein